MIVVFVVVLILTDCIKIVEIRKIVSVKKIKRACSTDSDNVARM